MKGGETEIVTSESSDNDEEDRDENREHVEGTQNYISRSWVTNLNTIVRMKLRKTMKQKLKHR